MSNTLKGLVAAVSLSAASATGAIAEGTQREILEIVTIEKPNGATDNGFVVSPEFCGDGGGTTYTSYNGLGGRIVMKDPVTGEIKNCGAYTSAERRLMEERDEDDKNSRPTGPTPNPGCDDFGNCG